MWSPWTISLFTLTGFSQRHDSALLWRIKEQNAKHAAHSDLRCQACLSFTTLTSTVTHWLTVSALRGGSVQGFCYIVYFLLGSFTLNTGWWGHLETLNTPTKFSRPSLKLHLKPMKHSRTSLQNTHPPQPAWNPLTTRTLVCHEGGLRCSHTNSEEC